VKVARSPGLHMHTGAKEKALSLPLKNEQTELAARPPLRHGQKVDQDKRLSNQHLVCTVVVLVFGFHSIALLATLRT